MSCDHNDWLDPSTCDTCLHDKARRIEAKANRERRQEQADKRAEQGNAKSGRVKANPFEVGVERYLTGEWCMKCKAPRDHHGFCRCDRERRYQHDRQGILLWADEHLDSPDAGLAALSATRRAVLQAGIGLDPMPGAGDRRTGEILRARIGLGVKPGKGQSAVPMRPPPPASADDVPL